MVNNQLYEFLFAGKELEILKRDAKRSQSKAFAPGTFANYLTQWVKYLSFLVNFGLAGLPATTGVLVWYMQYISRSLKAHSSIVAYLSGVKKLHELMGLPTTAFKGFLLKLTLQGLWRTNEHVPRRALPMTPSILWALVKVLDLTKVDEAVFWCLCLFAFFLLFRKSNLIPDTVEGFDPKWQLTYSDCMLMDQRLFVGIRWSKNAQFSRELLTFPLPKLDNSVLCPIKAFTNMSRLVKHAGKSHLFAIAKNKSFTYRQFHKMLRDKLKVAGIPNHKLFSSHSFRRGGTTFCFLCGIPLEIIRLLGNWRSDAFLAYIEFLLETQTAACERMKQCIKMCELQFK